MNAEPDYEYDVAISFLQEDEDRARELSGLLSERLSTFVYFDRQQELAGTDGEVTFSRVFGEASRIVVVLYRDAWGSTPWTRIEETAIRNRAYEEGYGFVVMIPLDERPSMPKWLPKASIWVGIERWGINGAAAVIEARVQESGGVPREESPSEQARRIGQQKESEDERLRLINSEGGVTKANAEVETLFAEIEAEAGKITDAGGEIKFGCKRVDRGTLNLYSWAYHIYISWAYTYSNTLHESLLNVRLIKRSRFAQFTDETPATLTSDDLNFDARLPDQFGWTRKGDNRFLTSRQLAHLCVKQLLNRLQEDQPWTRE